jgi:autotransporter-associated beta strand protein
MKNKSLSVFTAVSLSLAIATAGPLFIGLPTATAANAPDYFTGSATGDFGATAGNWNLGFPYSGINTLPGIGNDAVFAYGAASGIRTLNTASLTIGSLDDLTTAGAVGIQDDSATTNETLTLGGAGDLGNGVSIGQSNDLIYVASGATLNLYGKSGSTGVLGLVLGQSGDFDVVGTADIGSVISDGGNGYGITLSSAGVSGGSLVLSGQNTYSGATNLGAGTLELNFADTTYAAAEATTNIISSSSPLVFSGNATLNLNSPSSAVDSQSFSGTTLNGFGSVTFTQGNAAATTVLNLGAITRNAGGGINITEPTTDTTYSTTNGVTTTTANNAAGILGGWATVSGTGFAYNSAGSGLGNVIALPTASYTALTAAGGGTQSSTIFSDALGSTALTGAITADGVVFTTAGTLTLASGDGLTVNGANGGILADAATTIATVSGGVLGAGGAGTELILGGNSTLTISGNYLIGSNSGSLTKINSNTVSITGSNSYTGGTYIGAGTVTLTPQANGNTYSLGTGPITLAGGTINVASANTTVINPIIVAANTVNTATPSGFALTLAGALTGGGELLLNTGGGNYNGDIDGDLSQFTGTLTINTTNNGSNQTLGGTTAAALNLGQATFQVTGGTTSNRRLGFTNTVQLGALESAIGAGTFTSATIYVGALDTNTSFGGNQVSAQTINLTKVGTGSLSLNGNATFAGTVNLSANNGTLIVDESNLTTPTGLLAVSAPLAVGGGTFTLLEKAGTATSQAFSALTVNAGNSKVTANQNGGSAGVLLTLAGITRNAGGTVDFTNPSGSLGSTNGITTTKANTDGILGGWATVGGVAYAVSGASATVPVSALSTYANTNPTTDTTAADNDVENAAVTLTGNLTINSLTINDTGNNALNLSGNSVTFNGAGGGLLYAGNGSGGGSYTIEDTVGGGSIGAGAANEFILNVNSGATLTINTPIIGSGAGFLTTAGSGTIVLTAASSFTGTSFLNSGTLEISADGDLGSGNSTALLKINGGTLELASNYGSGATTLFSTQTNSDNAIILGNNGATINTNGNSVSYGGTISGGTVNTTSANTAGGFSFTKAGAGTLTLTANNTYGGATIITGGVLSVNNLNATETANGGVTSSIGEAPNTAPYLVLNGGTLQYIGAVAATTDRQFTLGVNGGGIDSSSPTADTLTWNGNTGSAGTAVDAVAFSGVGARTFTLLGSNTGVNTFGMILGNGAGGSTSLVKSGAGTWALTQANTYSGKTTINGGILNLLNGSIGSGAVNVNGGGTLGSIGTTSLGGAIGGAVTVAGGSTAGTQGTITLANTVGTVTLNLKGGLTLGGAAGNSSNVNLEVASSSADLLAITGALTVNAGGVNVTITNVGLQSNETYNLATFTGAGLYNGSAFSTGEGTTIDGFTLTDPGLSFGISGQLEVTAASGGTLELVTTGAVAPATAYWKGTNGAAWNSTAGSNANFTSDAAGATFLNAYPASSTTVVFAASGATNLSNSLGQSFSIAGLNFLAQDASSTTIGAVNITDSTYSLTIGSVGISDSNTNGVTLNPLALISGTNETWENYSGAALTISSPVKGVAPASVTTTLTVGNASTGATNLNGVINNGLIGGNLALNVNSTGAGNVVLGAANTFTGATTITQGTLQLSNANALQDTTLTDSGNDDLVFASSIGTFTLGGLSGAGNEVLTDLGSAAVTLQVGNDNANTTYSGALSDGGAGGALTKIGTGTLILNGVDTYIGATTVNGGALQIGDGTNGSISVSSAVSVGASGTLAIDLPSGGTFTNTVTDNGLVTVNEPSAGAFTLSGNIGGSGGVTESSNSTLTLSGNNSFSGVLTETAGSTLILTGSNGARPAGTAGRTVLNATGTLQLQANAGNTVSGTSYALGPEATAAALTYAPGSTLQLLSDSAVTFAGGNNMGGTAATTTYNFYVNNLGANGDTNANNTITFAPGGFAPAYGSGNGNATDTINVTGGNGYSLSLGSININADQFLALNPTTANLSVNGITNSVRTLTTEGTGTVTMLAPVSTSQALTFNVQAGTTVFAPGSNLTAGGAGTTLTVSSGANLVVSGSISGIIAAANISGNLEVDGSFNNSNTINVLSGGNLQGTGSVGGANLTDGSISPGDTIGSTAVGTLTANNSISLDGSSTLSIRLGLNSTTDTDQLDMANSSTLTLNDSLLNITVGAGANTLAALDQLYVIVNGGAGSTGSGIDVFSNAPTNGANFVYTNASGFVFNIFYATDAANDGNGGSDIDAELVAVPEPGTWASMLGGLGMLALWQRNRRRRH